MIRHLTAADVEAYEYAAADIFGVASTAVVTDSLELKRVCVFTAQPGGSDITS